MNKNLKSKTVYDQELKYASRYSNKSFLGRISFIVSIVLSLILWILEVCEINYHSTIRYVLFGLLFVLGFFTPVHILIFARCPKCKKVQPAGYGSAEVGTEAGLSYTKGFTPFRKRCCFCGTYLSVKQLEKDRLKQQNEQEIKGQNQQT